MGNGESERDGVTVRMAAGLLARSHLLPPDEVAEAVAEESAPLGVSAVGVYLADLQRRRLRPMPGGGRTEDLLIDTTVAGRVYRTGQLHHSPAGDDGGYRVWLPLIDGTERLGVLELHAAEVSGAMLDRYRMLASLTALLIVAKSGYSDSYAQLRRTQDMTLQAELVWAFTMPRTFATSRVVVAASLEPAYEVGGDAYDYSLTGDRLHVSVFDAAGHDLAAGMLASVGMASCRSTRRAGGTLADIAHRADHAIASQFGHNRFVTALLCDLDLASGEFAWIPCGHPPPLLLRGQKVVKELYRRPRLPLGITEPGQDQFTRPHDGQPTGDADDQVQTERLEPADRILLYTDGITEGRAADGTPFGVERLSDFINRHSDAGVSAPETLRRLTRAITEYQHGRLADDATIVMLEWLPSQPEATLTP